MEIIGSNVLDIDGHSSIEINTHSIVYRNEVDEEGYDLEDDCLKLANVLVTIRNKWKFFVDLRVYKDFIISNSKGNIDREELHTYLTKNFI